MEEKEFEVDNLQDLGVPQKQIEDLRDEDRAIRAKHEVVFGSRNSAHPNLYRYDQDLQKRAAEGLAVRPVTGKTIRDVLLEAGYTQAQANNPLLARSISNSRHFSAALAKLGIGPDATAQLLADGLMPTKPLIKGGKVVTDAEGQPVMVVDHEVRLKYLEMANKINGAYHETERKDPSPVSPVLIALVERVMQMDPDRQERLANNDFSVFDDTPGDEPAE